MPTDGKRKTIGFLMGVSHRGAHRYFDRELAPLGIQRGMLPVLRQLSRKDGISQRELSRDLFMDKAGVTRTLERMEAAGLVARTQDPHDRRSNLITLTPQAVAILPKLQAVLDGWSRILTRGMSASEQETLRKLLGQMSRNIVHHFGDDGGPAGA